MHHVKEPKGKGGKKPRSKKIIPKRIKKSEAWQQWDGQYNTDSEHAEHGVGAEPVTPAVENEEVSPEEDLENPPAEIEIPYVKMRDLKSDSMYRFGVPTYEGAPLYDSEERLGDRTETLHLSIDRYLPENTQIEVWSINGNWLRVKTTTRKKGVVKNERGKSVVKMIEDTDFGFMRAIDVNFFRMETMTMMPPEHIANGFWKSFKGSGTTESDVYYYIKATMGIWDEVAQAYEDIYSPIRGGRSLIDDIIYEMEDDPRELRIALSLLLRYRSGIDFDALLQRYISSKHKYLNELASAMPDQEPWNFYRMMSFETRLACVKSINKEWHVEGVKEDATIKLLTHVKEEDYGRMLLHLQADNFKLMQALHDGIDDQYRDHFYLLLNKWIMTVKDGDELAEELGVIIEEFMGGDSDSHGVDLFKKPDDQTHIFPYSTYGLFRSMVNPTYDYKITLRKGKVHVRVYMGSFMVKNMTLDPMETVGVYIYHTQDDLSSADYRTAMGMATNGRSGLMIMPAISLMYLDHMEDANDLQNLIDAAVIVLGVIAVATTGNPALLALAAVDLAYSIGNALVNDYEYEISQMSWGKEFLAAWNAVGIVLMVAGAAQLLAGGAKLVKNLAKAWKKVRAGVELLEEGSELAAEVNKVLDNVDDAKALSKGGGEALEDAGSAGRQFDGPNPNQLDEVGEAGAAGRGGKGKPKVQGEEGVKPKVQGEEAGKGKPKAQGEEGAQPGRELGQDELDEIMRIEAEIAQNQARMTNSIQKAAEAKEAFKAAVKQMNKALLKHMGRMNSFPGPFFDPDLYGAMVKMAVAGIKNGWNNSKALIAAIKNAKLNAGGLARLSPEEYAQAMRAWKDGGKLVNSARKPTRFWSGSGDVVAEYSHGRYIKFEKGADAIYGTRQIDLSEGTTALIGNSDAVKPFVELKQGFKGLFTRGANPGGLNVLRSGKWEDFWNGFSHIKNKAERLRLTSNKFWDEVNQPWLKDAADRGDEFRLLTNPKKQKFLWQGDANGFYFHNGKRIPTIFKKEIDFLVANGYHAPVFEDGAYIMRKIK